MSALIHTHDLPVRAAVTENDLTPSAKSDLRIQHGCGISSHKKIDSKQQPMHNLHLYVQ